MVTTAVLSIASIKILAVSLGQESLRSRLIVEVESLRSPL